MFIQVINFIMDAGSSVFMPVIILILGLIFGLKPGKAFKAGITVGIGFIGINLVISLLADNLMVVINQLVDVYGFKLTAVDVGWPIAASIAWSSGAVVPVILVSVFVMNILLILVGFTKTLDVDIWNYWQPLFIGGALYLISGNMILAVVTACISMAVIFKIADYSQPYVEKFFGMPGISIPHIESTGWALIGIPLNKLIDKIPIINRIDWTPEKTQKKLGVLGEPCVLGLMIGALLAIIARTDASTVLNTAMVTSAAMYLLPKMIGVLMEGLMPISGAASQFMQKRFKGRSLYIGLDAAVVVGHPSIIATSLLLIPTTLLLAVVIPGNVTLPLAELSGLAFFIVWAVVPCNGNVFRGWLIGTLFMSAILLISSDYAPVMTSLGQSVGFEFPEGASMVTCLSIGSQWISYVFYKIAVLFI
ncbi:PTS galactitol transporter subunit IIC [Lactonifactor longoviformis]|uniref:PTS system, galactitol-specific IIC component n=1 Tax=Lactonifactor longoviformis DSM 17459 TaxID=1122155 RepID=A0A1M5BXQ1_9CLOT|nr:PTS transporter subunit IIC [Lactonifactor longoviformis]POP33409.1 PTS galactitol transporter subunit IIC [Lactonifactor longoviformis]SHF47160.1 PTS system, galactitol-specific IIC component [Lactonifactor longoviformis DSM 17459]